MARILRYPFQISLDGRAATVEQDSEQAAREQIAVLALTRAGERALRPGFGLTDPTFDGFQPSELAAKLELYGPPVELGDITVTPRSADVQHVEILFEPAVEAT
jgi:hypothetical protein